MSARRQTATPRTLSRMALVVALSSALVDACTIGPQGPPGVTGDAGATGPDGLRGLMGPPGPSGPSDVVLMGPGGGSRRASARGISCGSTSPMTAAFPVVNHPDLGLVSGYRAAKWLCEIACGGAPGAHMCSTNEWLRSAQLGAIPEGTNEYWYGGGVLIEQDPDAGPPDGQIVVQDCAGWSSSSSANLGPTVTTDFSGPGGSFRVRPSYSSCQVSLPILCCL